MSIAELSMLVNSNFDKPLNELFIDSMRLYPSDKIIAKIADREICEAGGDEVAVGGIYKWNMSGTVAITYSLSRRNAGGGESADASVYFVVYKNNVKYASDSKTSSAVKHGTLLIEVLKDDVLSFGVGGSKDTGSLPMVYDVYIRGEVGFQPGQDLFDIVS